MGGVLSAQLYSNKALTALCGPTYRILKATDFIPTWLNNNVYQNVTEKDTGTLNQTHSLPLCICKMQKSRQILNRQVWKWLFKVRALQNGTGLHIMKETRLFLRLIQIPGGKAGFKVNREDQTLWRSLEWEPDFRQRHGHMSTSNTGRLREG